MKTGAVVLALVFAVVAVVYFALRAWICARARETRRCCACRRTRAFRYRLVRWKIAAVTQARPRFAAARSGALRSPVTGPQ